MAKSKRVEGPLPSGAAYAVIFYQDELGEAIDSEKATKAELIEYSEAGLHVLRTYIDLKPIKEGQDNDFA